MKIQRLLRIKKKLIILAVFYLVEICLLVVGYFFSDSLQEGIKRDKSFLQSNINSINSQIAELDKKVSEAKEAMKLWETLKQSNKKREGLQIDRAKNLLKDLEKHYFLSKATEVNLSTPVELSDIYKTKTTTVMSSEVSLKFSGLSDELLYGFIETIIRNLPGFIKIKSLQMDKKGEINEEVISDILKGNYKELVASELIFEWRDFKDIQNNNQDIGLKQFLENN